MIELRPARRDDIEPALRLREEAFRAHAPSTYSPAEVATLLGDVDRDELVDMIHDGQLFIAEADGVICGLAGWRERSLRHVYVTPSMTRRGIATRLLAHVEEDFQNRTGLGEIHAGVVLYAQPFYAANGYDTLARSRAWDASEYYEMSKKFERP